MKVEEEEEETFLDCFFEKHVYKILKIFLIYQLMLTVMTIAVVLIILNKITH